MNAGPRFLAIEDILALHAIAIEDQGGNPSIRDRGGLESAMAMPRQQFAGAYLHPDIQAMAAAYAFHVCMNHPFVDGNKRAATAAMIAFLADNGWAFDATPDEAEPMIRRLAEGNLNKESFTSWARTQMREKPKMELREFFSRIDSRSFIERFTSLVVAETGGTTAEWNKRYEEALPAMPFLGELAKQQNEARQSGDASGYNRVTMLLIGMITLYAIAEDQGYEW
ncbi:MAG: hypothetical protein FLDDKLPJ_01585 [Phycisphaerae bacterium]|nr:hypothetical protein [Phycisphaerae bacterium]